MRKFNAVFMRGGTSKGLMFKKSDLPEDTALWDSIFLQCMGDPDPKQIDGLGGTVSSSNKIVIVWKSEEPEMDVEYLVGQVIAGGSQVDYKSNCGNMTAAVAPFAVEEGLVEVKDPVTYVRMLNRNTQKKIEVSVPVTNGQFLNDGDAAIAGVDGTASKLMVNFLNPAGAKTGRLLPTGKETDTLSLSHGRKLEVSIVDVSNPMVMVRAKDVGLTALETPDEVNADDRAMDLLEEIRAAAAVKMGFAKDPDDARKNSPAVPKVGVYTVPSDFHDLSGNLKKKEDMDILVRVISVFKCHKACPLTSASSISVMMNLEDSILAKDLGLLRNQEIRIGHPSGIMTVMPHMEKTEEKTIVHGVAVARTARRIMEGTVFIRE